MEQTLELELEVEPRRSSRREEFRAVASILNRGAALVTLSLEPLRSASLALEILGPDGERVGLPPPPIPRKPRRRVELRPGERYRREFRNFVPQWTETGAYRVRFTYGYRTEEGDEWQGSESSDWVELEVAES